MTPTRGVELDLGAVLAAFATRVADLPPDERALAQRTLERLRPPNWTLEWYLPWWLGRSMGLRASVSQDVVVSNVLGLVGVRLADDARDGELVGVDVTAARRLASALIERAVAMYRPLFPDGTPFWSDLARDLGAWEAAERTPRSSGPRRVTRAALARRAAPLKIGARAICRLAGRLDSWPALERGLDHGLAALALYDDICDWEHDLEAGRWNAFIAGTAAGSQRPANRDRNRTAVLLAMVTRGAAGEAMARVRLEALRAADLAQRAGCEPLGAHFRWLAERAAGQGSEVDGHYAALGERMARLFLGPPVVETPMGGGIS